MHPAARLRPSGPPGIVWGAFGIRRVHRSGPVPPRVLVIGSRPLLRERRTRTALAGLVDDVADRIWLSTRRGLDVDVAWELRHGVRAVLKDLRALRISRYDSVVLLEPARTPGSSRRQRRIDRLRAAIRRELSPRSRFLSVALGAGTGRGPAGAADASTFPPSAAADIAARLRIPLLGSTRGPGEGPAPGEDVDRERAADALGLAGRADDEVLQRLVEQAADRFSTPFAELNVVGRQTQWSLAAAGLARGSRSSEGSLCDLAVRSGGPTVLEDTLTALPVNRIPRLADGRLVRFYAGHPIQSIGGHRIGVLCVYDSRPHRLQDADITALRDLALAAEARVIGA